MPADFSAQVRRVIRNMETILAGVGSSLFDVVKANAYLADFDRFNAVYSTFFEDNLPVRTTIVCALNGILFEVDCVAVLAEQ